MNYLQFRLQGQKTEQKLLKLVSSSRKGFYPLKTFLPTAIENIIVFFIARQDLIDNGLQTIYLHLFFCSVFSLFNSFD
jgi:hypothetical protein